MGQEVRSQVVTQPARMQKHPLGPRGIAERGPGGAQARTPEGKNQLSPSRSPESLRPSPVSSPPSPQTLLPPQLPQMPSGQEPGLREERTEQGEGWQRPATSSPLLRRKMTSGLNCARNRKVEVGTETLARTSVTELRHACHFGSPQDCLPLSEKQSRTESGEISDRRRRAT